jgi:hypothetical protein
MCASLPVWLTANAGVLAGFLGIVGSILLAVPTFLGAGLREDKLRLDEMQMRLREPELLEPLALRALTQSVAFFRREQRWMRAGALCLLLAFALTSLQAGCAG